MARSYEKNQQSLTQLIAETLHRESGLMCARNDVSGQDHEFKFGFQPDISSAELPLWDVAEAYAYQATALPMLVSSPNAADQDTGTGARTVKIFGLDANYAEINETVTLASVTAVTTTNSYLRVFRMQVITAGSGEKNAGIIYAGASTVTSGTPADKYAAISVGENQTLMALYTVPAAKTAYIKAFGSSSGEATADRGAIVRLKMRPLNQVFQTQDKFELVRQHVNILHHRPLTIAAKTDIQVTAIRSGATDVGVSGHFELIVIDD